MFILTLIIFLFSGWFLVNAVNNKLSLFEKVGLSFFFGLAVHVFTVYILVLRLKYYDISQFVLLIIELFLFFLVYWIVNHKKNKKFIFLEFKKNKSEKKKMNAGSIVLVFISVLVLLYTFVQCIYWPPTTPDALDLYDFRPKLFLEGKKDIFFSTDPRLKYQNQYPPFTSIMHLVVYETGYDNPKVMYSLAYIFFYILLIGTLRKETKSDFLSLLFSFLLIFAPGIWWNSFLSVTNLILMEYLGIATFYLLSETAKENSDFAVGIFALTVVPFIRMEPFWIIPLFLFFIKAMLVKKLKVFTFALGGILFTIFIWPYNLFFISYQLYLPKFFKFIPRVGYPVKMATLPDKGLALVAHKLVDKPTFVESVVYSLKPTFSSLNYILILFIGFIVEKLIWIKKIPSLIQIAAFMYLLAIVLGFSYFSSGYSEWKELYYSLFRMSAIAAPAMVWGIADPVVIKKLKKFIDFK